MRVRPLRIAYLGNFRPTHSTETHVAASLELLGHRVERLQEDAVSSAAVLDAGRDSDLLLWTRTWGVAGIDRALSVLHDEGVPTASYHLDLYARIDREAQIGHDPFWRTKYVFTADGGSGALFAERNVNHFWLPAACFGPECVEGTRRAEYVYDVVFVGSYRYHREWPYRRQLIDWLTRTYRGRFMAFGAVGNQVRYPELNDVYASATVVVGDSLCPGFDHPNYWSDRVYETLGRGGALVFPDVPGIREHFTDGEHLRLYAYNDWNGLRAVVDELLGDPEAARAMAKRGQEHVRANHTYEHRVASLLATIAQHEPQLRGVDITPRPATADAEIIREIVDENVYRITADDVVDGTVVDLGANVGVFSLQALALGAQRVIAVEPDVESVTLLEEHVRQARAESQVVIRHVAVGRRPGKARLLAGANTGGHQLSYDGEDGTPVVVTDLDSLLADVEEVAVLKLDVEGSEYAVLDGASPETLAKVRYLVMEFHNAERGKFGRMIEKLAAHFCVQTLGAPDRGGYVYARSYEPRAMMEP